MYMYISKDNIVLYLCIYIQTISREKQREREGREGRERYIGRVREKERDKRQKTERMLAANFGSLF